MNDRLICWMTHTRFRAVDVNGVRKWGCIDCQFVKTSRLPKWLPETLYIWSSQIL